MSAPQLHKLLIVSSDTSLPSWKSLNRKLSQVLEALNQTKNAKWEAEIRYQPLVPTVYNGRIPHAYMDEVTRPHFEAGYQHVVLHFSMKQWEMWGLEGSLRGANHTDRDVVNESYIRADESTKRGRYNQFVQTLLHEVWHGLCKSTNTPDTLHQWHDTKNDIAKAGWGIFDMDYWHPEFVAKKQELSLWQRVFELTKTLSGLKKN